RAIARVLPSLRAAEGVDFVIANVENASGGKGIDPDSAEELGDAGVDVLTTGNHVWRNPGIVPYMQENTRLLRPQNFARGIPGTGWTVQTPNGGGVPVAVLNLIGRVFMEPSDCPFRAAEEALAAIGSRASVIFVDMHGEATSEKVGMGR